MRQTRRKPRTGVAKLNTAISALSTITSWGVDVTNPLDKPVEKPPTKRSANPPPPFPEALRKPILALLEEHDGKAVIWLLLEDTSGYYGKRWNTRFANTHEKYLPAIYEKPLVYIAQRVNEGDVLTVEALQTAIEEGLGMNAKKYNILSYKRDNPKVHRKLKREGDEPEKLLTTGVDVALAAACTRDPAQRLLLKELLVQVHRHGSFFTRPQRQALVLLRNFDFLKEKTHGAVIALARRAVTNKLGKITRFHSRNVDVDEAFRPDERVVRQVRRILQEALDRLRVLATRLGYEMS